LVVRRIVAGGWVLVGVGLGLDGVSLGMGVMAWKVAVRSGVRVWMVERGWAVIVGGGKGLAKWHPDIRVQNIPRARKTRRVGRFLFTGRQAKAGFVMESGSFTRMPGG
jgi:hypothetical protein